VAWTAMPYRGKVVGVDGSQVGTVESLLGDEGADIFHGIVVKRSHGGHLVEIAAANIKRITATTVQTDLREADLEGLQPYREEHWFHLGWGGLFRRHPEWKED